MDLNYLLSRQQISLMRADAAASPEARVAHRSLAQCYADRIRTVQAGIGLPRLALAEG
ncbi:hypothetical protein ACMGDH_13475 [Sphingomonas sp. DT-207]|uniref:hypothetical protein n=1 Tax=Sphingomonas sp. DT-207 TaxID=3396167 RepID=UPI003F1B40BF